MVHAGTNHGRDQSGKCAVQQLSIASQRWAATGPSASTRNDTATDSASAASASRPPHPAFTAAGASPTTSPPATKHAGNDAHTARGATSAAGTHRCHTGHPAVRTNHHADAT